MESAPLPDMNLMPGAPASPTFQQPLALLSDCHRRVERFLSILHLLALEEREEPLDATRRDALAGALRYFREAAQRHTADEEESLFPRLRDSGSPDAAAVMTRLDRLEQDHAAAAPDHQAVELLGARWLETGILDAASRTELRERVDRLVDLYAGHIALEDSEIFPTAARVLDAPTLETVGREMAARRGQPFVPPGFESRSPASFSHGR